MSLEPTKQTPGLWRDSNWQPGMPGVYAVVVGASSYPFLAGGTSPAPDTYGLEQLISSAGTAAHVFTWLRTTYRRQELPVVWCQLLLSPTAAERATFAADGLDHYAEPTDAQLRVAIQRWTGNVPTAAPATNASRTFFFFSGHGVQANSEALLLPSDYLDPSFGAPQFEKCISVRELRRWMEENPVAEHLALIDACRNQFSPLASKGASAHSAFPVNPPGNSPPRTVACLASTSPNAVAYQVPEHPLTFFGQALLEGLCGLENARRHPKVEFLQLVSYVTPRVNQLLKAASNTSLDQTVRPNIEGDYTLVVTEIPPGVGQKPQYRPLTALRALRGTTDTLSVVEALESRFDSSLVVDDCIPLATLTASYTEAHRRFGHEYATELWTGGVRLHALDDGRLLANGADIVRVERDPASRIVRVDLELAPSEHGVLAVLEGSTVQRERLSIPLPTDRDGRVPIRLTLTFAEDAPEVPPRLQAVDARLGPATHNRHYAYLWTLTREADVGSLVAAAGRANRDQLTAAVRDKFRSPTAAIAGVLLLARAGEITSIDDWPRNLMRWFPEISDGAVLWAEALRAAILHGDPHPHGLADPVGEAADALSILLARGLPFFADTIDFADSLTRWVARTSRDEPTRARMALVSARLARAAEVASPSGHFMVLAGHPRPTFLNPGGALTTEEMRRIVRPESGLGAT